jgi:hypothetical protein
MRTIANHQLTQLPDLSVTERAAGDTCIARMLTQEARLQAIDPVILDLSIREPAVGVPCGHTVDNKFALLQLAREVGLGDLVLGTFDVSLPEVPQVDDLFVQEMRARGMDFTGTFAFATIGKLQGGQFVPDISLKKLVDYGIPNTIVDVDISRAYVAPDPAARLAFAQRLVASIDWMITHMKGDRGGAPRIYINYQDLPDAFFEDWVWVAQLTKLLATQPVAAVTFEDGKGSMLPFQVGTAVTLLRQQMRPEQRLLVHMHTGSGMENANLIEALLCGADGIWAGFAREAATIGHAPSSEFLANLRRVGNCGVATKYRLERLVPIVQEMTRINTLGPVPDDVPIAGANAYRTMLTFFSQETGRKMDLPPQTIGARPGWRIAPVASDNPVIAGRLQEVGVPAGEVDQALLDRMRTLMRQDMRDGLRIAYDDPQHLLELYRRAKSA